MLRTILLLLLVPLLVLPAASAAPASRARPAYLPAAAAPSLPGPPSFGLNSHLATRYPDPSSMDHAASIVANLRVQWVREDLHWHRVQPARDVWDWTFTDAALNELHERDIQVLGVLGPSVGWATPYRGDTSHDVSFYPPDTRAFLDYVRAVVQRYHHQIDHWEIWNEPDNPLFWKPEPDPAAYADLLIGASKVIKEIDPDAQVLIGGFNSFDTRFARTVAEAGAWDSFDILAIHPYVDPYSPEEGNIVAALDKAHILNYMFGEKPIWVTEIGWASGPSDRDPTGRTDEAMQAHFLVRGLLLLWLSGAENIFWYTLKDDPGNPYGLIAYGEGRTDLRLRLRKPAYTALRTLNRELAGTEFVERRDLFDTTSLVRFARSEQWQRPTQPNGELQVGLQGVARLTYNFSTGGNDYVAFELHEPLTLPHDTYALGLWVYGDGSDNQVRVWLRDAEGERLQFTPGIVGDPGWSFVSTPIDVPVEPGNRLEGSGNGQLDFPATLEAVVIDDAYDEFIGIRTIYLNNLTAIGGREVYDIRLANGSAALDIIWSPPGVRATLNTTSRQGHLIHLDDRTHDLRAEEGRFVLDIDAAPIFVWHRR